MYRKLQHDIEGSQNAMENLLIGKPKLDQQIETYSEKVKKLNNKIDEFYDRMYEHHKLNLKKERQNKMQEIYANHKQEVLSKYKIQGEVWKGIMKQYEKHKADSEAKNKKTITFKGCHVIIKSGDLTEEREDAIVSWTNEQLNHRGRLAKVIALKGGEVVQKESEEYIKRYGNLPIGKAITTDAGDLPCERVIHVVRPIHSKDNLRNQKQREQVRDGIKSMLREMKIHNMNCVSFPAISTGLLRSSLESCAVDIGEVLREAIDKDPEFFKDKRLIICNLDNKITNKMLEYIPKCLREIGMIINIYK